MTYRPPHVRADERGPLLVLIAENPLATLITVADGMPLTTYVPLLAREEDGQLYLEGHLARANDQWKHGDSTCAALFRVADAYVSPNWYATKREHGKVVPTWDYVAVEARGTVRFIEDRAWKLEFVSRLTDSQEARVGEGWKVSDAPADYMESQLAAIVGLQIRVDELTGLFKLNRHHPEANVAGVIAGMEKLDNPSAHAIAAYMRADLAKRS
jgi:transcriptional regulator